jgi:hypothetical protein
MASVLTLLYALAICSLCYTVQPKEIKDIKTFLEVATRKDARGASVLFFSKG